MASASDFDTLADVLESLGRIPASRVLLKPVPGTATEDDVIALLEGPNKRLCELIDGVLVEKDMETRESLLAGFIFRKVGDFVDEHDLGETLPGDGALRLLRGLIRYPDVCFIGWDRMPDGF